MKKPDRVVNLRNLFELVRVYQFFIIFKLTIMMTMVLFFEFLVQQASVRVAVHHVVL